MDEVKRRKRRKKKFPNEFVALSAKQLTGTGERKGTINENEFGITWCG